MFKNLSLRSKIFSLVSIVVIVSFLTLTLVVSNKAYEMAKKDAFSLAQETADKYKNEIRAELQGARITAETLASVFESLKANGITDRDIMNDLLSHALSKKEYVTAFCIAYEPDALDGKDKQFAGVAPAYDETGRYAPYWNKFGDKIDVEPLYDIDIADWYIVPKSTMHEYITDPYPYHIQGRPVMLASMIFPIIVDGEFIGIMSSDFVLDKLQEMISKVNPHGQGGLAKILSNAGAVVAAPDKEHLGEDLSESLAHEMLTLDHGKVSDAVKYAGDYLARNPGEDGSKFMDALNDFAKDPGKASLDLTLMTPETAMAILQADPARLNSAVEAKAAIKSGEMYIVSDKQFYTVYMPIQFSEVTTPWSVAVSIPMAKILDNASGIRNYVVTVSAAAICIIALILYMIAKNVTHPILVLSNAAKILGEGNFDVETPVIESNDEIGALSRAFDFMAKKINNLIKEMQGYAKTLEEKNIYLNRLNDLKDEFLANTSHELRTPINGIIGIVESMIDGATGSLTKEQKYNLTIVSSSGKRLSNLINDILDFTKLKNKEIELKVKPIDLKTIADAVIILLKPLTKGKDLALVNGIDDSLPAISADENRIQQILHNLIGNAIKFTEKGQVRVSAKVTDDMIAVSVEDTGIGISEDKFDRIFESFEQADGSTSREYGGTGLGLSITKKIVELHGGTICVESQSEKGSVFTFTVPLAKDAAGDIAKAEMPQTTIDAERFEEESPADGHVTDADDSRGWHRILIVDDEPVNIQVLSNLLSMQNYTVFKAYSGAEALEMMESHGGFDLVLLDVMMPKMSGYEVCRRLRENHTMFDLPILMLTAKNQTQDIVLGFQSGANDYVQKPFDKDELLARVRTLLELKHAMSEAMAANKAKSLFLANMSHEVRTPLNAMVGLTTLLLKTPMDDRQRDYTEKMHRASTTLQGLIDDILDFTKIEAGDMKLQCISFDIKKLFDDLFVFFQEQNAGPDVALRFQIDPALPSALMGDPVRLQQIFINLVDNACKFTEKGSVTVSVTASELGQDSVTVGFAVEDTGIGMSQEQIEGIFAAFNQADNSSTRKYGGTGIGLSITRQMVELMGGEISVESEEGKGTKFSFSCKFALDEDVSKTKEPDEGKDVSLSGMRVLLVEDNEINAMIASELLEAVGVIVTTAENGQEALNRLAASRADAGGGQPFDLILMDLQMPVMDGYEATKIIKGMPEYKDIPIYALTAHAFPEERDRCLSLGMGKHLTKPIDVESFYAALRDAAAAIRM
ncbi:MAG: response regulator [Synergistaceae bacterium]|jgi:signal transduction histidine kinase|nr:response regulator [Synergistaceae bacterium]